MGMRVEFHLIPESAVQKIQQGQDRHQKYNWTLFLSLQWTANQVTCEQVFTGCSEFIALAEMSGSRTERQKSLSRNTVPNPDNLLVDTRFYTWTYQSWSLTRMITSLVLDRERKQRLIG